MGRERYVHTMIEALRRMDRNHRLIPVAIGLWNTLGVLGFTMAASRNPDGLADVPPQVIDWLDSTPAWTIGAGALVVGGGFVGALLVLERSRGAVAAFLASLMGMAVLQVWVPGAHPPAALTTPGVMLVVLLIWGVALAQQRYVWRQWRAGVLR